AWRLHSDALIIAQVHQLRRSARGATANRPRAEAVPGDRSPIAFFISSCISGSRPLTNHRQQFFFRLGAREQITLADVAAHVAQYVELARSLDSFRHRGQSELMCKFDDGLTKPFVHPVGVAV